MVANFFKLTILSITITSTVFSQQHEDSLIYAEGSIINAETRQPVDARITYKSLPYGNRMGVINGSGYTFPMFDGEKYSITVESLGFTTAKYLLDPSDANDASKVIKNIELSKGPTTGHEAGQVMLLDNLIFQVGRSRLSEESYPELDLVVNMMRENHKMVVQLEGHTDYRGDARQNLKLSQQRVKAVKAYLVSQGIKSNRVRTKAFGGTQPISRDNTPEAHRMNRRVELRILEN